MTLAHIEDVSGAFVDLLHGWDLHRRIDRLVRLLHMLSFPQLDNLNLMFESVELAEGEEGAGRLTSHVHVEEKFDVCWVSHDLICHLKYLL